VKIEIVKGHGAGLTKMAAFDRALCDAGIANYNLIYLSSVMPPDTEISIANKRKPNIKEYGHKLYVVMAESYSDNIREEAWSGIGWLNHNDGSGKGLFVEHSARSEKKLIELIKTTLKSMSQYRPEERGDIHYETCGIECKKDDNFVCLSRSYQGGTGAER